MIQTVGSVAGVAEIPAILIAARLRASPVSNVIEAVFKLLPRHRGAIAPGFLAARDLPG